MKRNMSLSFLALALFAAAGAHALELDASEAARIRFLVASVETLQGATFVRNGREYDARAASSHLQRKLKYAGSRVRTAEDFIALCGSKSSVTGEPYLIRLADGTTVKTEAFFRKKLRAFTAGMPQPGAR